MGGYKQMLGGVTIGDPDGNVTVCAMFWFAYLSVVFCIHKIYISLRMSFLCSELLLFNYAKVQFSILWHLYN